jgi:hypothetical protein
MKNQTEAIHEALKRGPLTAWDAMQMGCFRLAARIHDLRAEGVEIETQNVKHNGKNFAEYRLA